MQTPRKSDLPWFVYIRVSDKDQGDKYGPSRQVEAIRNWLKVNAPDVSVPGLDACVVNPREVRASEYVGFDKQSGKNDDRADFQRGCDLAKRGRIGGFLSLRLDRVARNAQDALILRSRLKRMGVRLEFATQAFDNTATGDLMYTVYAGFAELEGKLIIERTTEGRIGRLVDDKLFLGNTIPWGYTYVDEEVAKKHPGKRGLAIVDEPAAKIVRLIFRWYIEDDLTAYEIALRLNRKKIKTAKGNAWWRESVGNLLRKADSYAGKHTVRLGIEAAKREHAERVKLMGEEAAGPLDLSGLETATLDLPPLITQEAARLTHAKQTLNKEKRAGRPGKRFPLSKFVHCGLEDCEAVWYFKHEKRRDIAFCSTRQYNRDGIGNGGRARCSSKQVAYAKLERTVIDALKDHLRTPEVAYSAAMQAYQESQKDEGRKESPAETLAALREEQEHFGKLLLNAAMKKLHARAEIRYGELEIQIQKLEQESRRAPVRVLYSKASIVAAFGQKLEALEEMETFEEKREFFEATLQQVDMRRDEVVITGSIAVAAEGQNWKERQSVASSFTPLPFVIRRALPKRTPEEIAAHTAKVWAARRRNGTVQTRTPKQIKATAAKGAETRRRNRKGRAA